MQDIPLCTNKVDDENHCDVLTLTSSVPSLTYKCTNTDKIDHSAVQILTKLNRSRHVPEIFFQNLTSNNIYCKTYCLKITEYTQTGCPRP